MGANLAEVSRRFLSHLAVEAMKFEQQGVHLGMQRGSIQADLACLRQKDWVAVRRILRIQCGSNFMGLLFVANVVCEEFTA